MTDDIWNRTQRPKKAYAQEKAFLGIGPRKSGIFLPAKGCHCLKLTINMGVIDPARSHIIAVEKDPSIESEMRQTLDTMNLAQIEVHADWLHTLILPKKLDFGFFDLSGAITYETAQWFTEELSPNLLPDADICIALNKAFRGNRFMPHMKHVFGTAFDRECTALAEELHLTDYETTIPILALFRVLFREWNFYNPRRLSYCDKTNNMNIYRLSKFTPKKPTWPHFNEVIIPEEYAKSSFRMSSIERASRLVKRPEAKIMSQQTDLLKQLTQMGLRLINDENEWSIRVAKTNVELRRFNDFEEVYNTFL